MVGTGVALLVGFVQGRLEDDESSSTSDTDDLHEANGRTHPPLSEQYRRRKW